MDPRSIGHRRQRSSVTWTPDLKLDGLIERIKGFFDEVHIYDLDVQTELKEAKDVFRKWTDKNLEAAKDLGENYMRNPDEKARHTTLWYILSKIWGHACTLEEDRWDDVLEKAAASVNPATPSGATDMQKLTEDYLSGLHQVALNAELHKETLNEAISGIKESVEKLKKEFKSLSSPNEPDSENSEPESNASSGDADAAFQRLENDKAEKRKQIAEGLSTRDRPGRSDNNSSGNAPPTSLTLDQINVSFGKRPNGGRAGAEERHSGR